MTLRLYIPQHFSTRHGTSVNLCDKAKLARSWRQSKQHECPLLQTIIDDDDAGIGSS
jgi:hypothetical protein